MCLERTPRLGGRGLSISRTHWPNHFFLSFLQPFLYRHTVGQYSYINILQYIGVNQSSKYIAIVKRISTIYCSQYILSTTYCCAALLCMFSHYYVCVMCVCTHLCVCVLVGECMCVCACVCWWVSTCLRACKCCVGCAY